MGLGELVSISTSRLSSTGLTLTGSFTSPTLLMKALVPQATVLKPTPPSRG